MAKTQHLTAMLDDKINEGDYQFVQYLLDQGADVNGRDVVGDTPLLSAAWVGASDLVRLLVERGADVNAIGKQGKTAFQLAKEIGEDERAIGHHEVARILKEAGAEG